jgi:Na+/proline symporter
MPNLPFSYSVTLSSLDYGVIVGYMLVLMGMGWYFRKSAQKDLESYFLGGRKMPGWLNGFSYAATCMNSDVAPAYCGMTVITGTFICWWYLSRFGLALMIGAVLFAIFWRRLALATAPEFYELRFSGSIGLSIRTWVALRSAFIAVVAWTGSGLLGMHKITSPLLGWDRTETFLYVIPVILFYVLLSGYIGVVWSDFFQTLIIISASIMLMVQVWIEFGGPMGLQTALVDQFGSGVVSWHPPLRHELLGVIGVIAWTMGTAIGYGGDAAPMAGAMEGQRILSCKNGREASKMFIWTQVVLFFMLATLTLPALGAMAKWPGLYSQEINKELAFGMLLGHYMPSGLLGLAIAGILAAIMSTVSSNMNFGAQVFVNDVYARSLVKHASTKHYMFVGRIIATLIVLMAIGVATVAENVIDISVFMLGLSAAELTANWAQWWWWRFNGKARLAASLGGPMIYLLNYFLLLRATPYKLESYPAMFAVPIEAVNAFIARRVEFCQQLLPTEWHGLDDGTYTIVLLSMLETLVLWVTVALLTKPEPHELLVAFYRRSKPLGWWGPIAREVDGSAAPGAKPIAIGLLIAGMGAVMVGSGVVALSAAYVGNNNIAIVGLTAAVTSGIFFKLSYDRFINQLADDTL